MPERLVVVILSADDALPVPGVTCVGVNVHVAPDGRPEHDKLTAPRYPPTAVTLIELEAVEPAFTVADDGVAVTTKLVG